MTHSYVNKLVESSTDGTTTELVNGARRGVSGLDLTHFYNNFFLTDLNFWRSEPVVAYLSYLRDSDDFWQGGWGDSLIMAHTLRVFAPPEKLVMLAGLNFTHAKPKGEKAPRRDVTSPDVFRIGEAPWSFFMSRAADYKNQHGAGLAERIFEAWPSATWFCQVTVLPLNLSRSLGPCSTTPGEILGAHPPEAELCKVVASGRAKEWKRLRH